MATKEEWLEYFKMINGREPTADELSAAEAAHEFVTEELPKLTSPSLQVQPVLAEIFSKKQFEDLSRAKIYVLIAIGIHVLSFLLGLMRSLGIWTLTELIALSLMWFAFTRIGTREEKVWRTLLLIYGIY